MSFVAFDCACVVVNTKSRRKAFDKTLLLSAAAVALIATPAAQANPIGGTVSTGSASVSTSSNKTSVNQKSEDVVINWSSFNIGAGQTTQFYQPNAQAIAVNRIGGANASQILGTLDANGRVVLIDGNGVLFGKGAQVNVGSLIATSTDGSDSDVLSGKFTQAGKQNASVINNGAITTASGGVVALVAPNVSNTGTVNAKLGTIALGAANKFTVDFTGDGLVSFAAQGDVNARASAINSGLLSGANVSMTAHAANGIATGIVNMSGIVTAQGVQNIGGTIYLNAGNGTLTTSGTLNAAGATGGGQIETSGHVANISGRITAGQGGQWKVDPEDLTIDSTAATTIDGALNLGTSVLEQTTSGAASGSGNQTSGAGNITVASALAWNSTATLTLDSYHSINIAAPITISGAGGLTLITNDNGGSGGDYFFNNGADVAFTDVVGSATQGSLTINGTGFTLANSIAQLKTDVANFSGSHFYALANSYDASGDNGGTPYTSSIIGFMAQGIIEGLGNTISKLSIDSAGGSVGLFSLIAGGTVRDLGLIDVNIVASGSSSISAGAFAALNAGGTLLNDWATGRISGGSGPHDLFGGLVGDNVATIANSHAAVAVTNLTSGAELGGLAGFNGGTISGTYATGAITGGSGGTAGGLVGISSGTISQSYATGVVIAGTSGGLVGGDTGASGDITSSYWDLQTSGISNPSQGAGNTSNDSGITGETTAALQGTLPSGFSNSTWSTGAGLYPYLSWQFSGTPQVLSGLAFGDHGVTPLQAGSVYVDANGSSFATLTTGADGYFYDVVAPGTFTTSEPLLAYTTGANNGAHLEAFSRSAAGFDIWGNTLIAPTSDTIYSIASGTSLQTQDSSLIATAVGSDSNASFVTGLTNFGYVATGIGFITIQSLAPANGLFVETRNGDLIVAAPIVIAGANGLTLYASDALTIVAPIFITDGGAVALAAGYDTTTVPGTPLLELSFGLGPNGFAGSLNFNPGSGEGISGQSLTINGTQLTLLYSMADVQSIDCSFDVSTCGGAAASASLSGNYALADSLNASGFGSKAIGAGDIIPFTGSFEGLGHTISNLSFANLNPPAGQGLFSGSAGSIRDIGMVGGSIGCCGDNGFLVGVDAGVIENTFETGTVQSGSRVDPTTYTGGLVGWATSTAVIANSFATGQITYVTGNTGGLVGDLQGTLVNDYATVSVVKLGGGSVLGGLVGEADSGSRIENSYATGAVFGTSEVGGLVGYLDGGSISGSFATGAVSGTFDVGGLVGESEEGAIANSYAMGSVHGTSVVGGLVGALFDPSSSVTDSFSIGSVTGSSNANGLVGEQSDSGGVTDGYWDTQTSGQSSGGTGASPLTTAQMQGTLANMPGFAGPTWSTATGLFPYLSWQFASTPQAVSGIAYSNGGGTPLQGGTVSTLVDGAALGTASTGANGYYYLLVTPGTIPAGNDAVLAYSSASGARLDTATDALDTNSNVSGFDVWGNTLIAPTSDTTYSTASATSLQTQDSALIAQAIGGNANPTTGITNFGYIATGSGFTIDQPLTLSNGLYVKTTSGNITVDDALTLVGSEGLTLYSSNALTIDAPVNVTGAGAVALAAGYDTTTVPGTPLLELSFGLGPNGFAGSVNYGSTNNGGTLTINGTSYTLLYSMSDLDSLACSNDSGICVNPDAENLAGNYALADSLDASGFGYVPIGAGLIVPFTGMFEGLGHTISNLSFSSLNPPAGQGLFSGSSGSIRDIGMVGGSVNCCSTAGFLAGLDAGVIENTFETGTVVSGSSGDPSVFTGGLVGQVTGTGVVANSFAAGQISQVVSSAGGLVGDLQGTLVNDYATISMVGFEAGTFDVGGLVGEADSGSRIEDSYATGSITTSGSSQRIGGLVGYLDGGTISGSFATGAVAGSSFVGGLVGESEEGAISNSYAMGAVSGTSIVGGLVGALFDPSSSVTDSYSIGRVTGSSNVGGLVGEQSDSGGVSDSYWDWQTSGMMTDGAGATKLTTANMQVTFANMTGFAGPTWATGTGLFPYLSWQFASTPQAISGKVFSGSTEIAGENVGLLINGAATAPAFDTTSGADGYYYLLLAPGTISNAGSDILTYLTSGTPANTFVQGATGTHGNVDLFENTFMAASHASDSAAILAEIPAALGSASGPQFLYTATSGVVPGVNLVIYDTAAAFTLDSSLNVGNAILELYTTGTDTQTSGTVTANQLISNSTGGLSLGDANAIANLGVVSNSGAGGISVTDAHALTIGGNLSTGTGDIDLTTTGSGNGIAIDNHLVGGTVDLVSAGTIRENGTNGFIHASVLEGSSVGNAFFNEANKIDAVNDFSTGGAGAFSLYDWKTLDETGLINAGKHSITLDTQIGDLDIGGALIGGTITLNSLNGEVNGAGIVDAKLLNVSANTGIDLYGTNNDIQAVGTDTTNSGPNIINKGD